MRRVYKVYNALNYKPTVAHIDLAAVQHNCRVVKSKAPKSKILAVVKSNAYGHGVVPIANALNSLVDAFGVAWLDEAIKVKESGINKQILLLKGFLTQEELQLIAELRLATVVHSFHQIELLERVRLPNSVNVWLKIDTGMHRLGFQPEELAAAYQRLMANSNVTKPLLLMSHLANADDMNNAQNTQQIALFHNITQNFPAMKSIANSATLFTRPDAQVDWVRAGILLYGASPFSDSTGEELGLKPAMTLTSQLFAIQHLQKGAPIGYGSTWVCPEDMPVGLVNIGYGDGYPRQVQNGTPLLINNIRCATVGKVSMDMLAIDLRSHPQAKIGDSVTLWGKGLPIEEIAKFSNSIVHELFCRLTPRVYLQYHE